MTTVICTAFTTSGSGSTVVVSAAADSIGTATDTVTLTFTFTAPATSSTFSVPISACQGASCLPSGFASITINPFSSPLVGPADFIVLSAPSTVGCGSPVTITAFVTSGGLPVPDGTLVVFTSSVAGSASALTFGGSASVTLFVPSGFTGLIVVTAASGGAASQIAISVTCPTGGPPALVTLTTAPTAISCGNDATIVARVTDAFGRPVADGTRVLFSTTLGTIPGSAPTNGGNANAVLTSAPGSAGTAVITATAGTVQAKISVPVSCAAAAAAPSFPAVAVPAGAIPAIPAAIPAVPAVPATTIRPPSTGDAGLK